MFPINKPNLFLLMSLFIVLTPATLLASGADAVRVEARVVGQRSCAGDDDLFTVSLDIKLTVSNISDKQVTLPSNLVPWVAKVAPDLVSAKLGHYLYEVTWSHYPQDPRDAKLLRIKPGKSIVLDTGYDLTARYRATFDYPKSLSAGRYVLVLTLRPEATLRDELGQYRVLENLTTGPITFEVPQKPFVTSCRAR